MDKIREILESHNEAYWNQQGLKVCFCGHVYTDGYGSSFMIDHVAEVLDEYMQSVVEKAQANTLIGVANEWEKLSSPGAHHLYARMLRLVVNQLGEEPNV